jgi:hypothetical protein
MDPRELEHLGEPDLTIAGLRLWVHGRQFPQSSDYWDGNWLRVTAYSVYPDSQVRAHGPIVHLSEIVVLLRECKRLYQSLEGTAGLRCIEPNLRVELVAENRGRIKMALSITPDQMTESHSFTDDLDQTYLPPIIAACQTILEKFPVREAEDLPE